MQTSALLPPAKPRIAYFTEYPTRDAMLRTAFGAAYVLERCDTPESLVRSVGTGTIDLALSDLIGPGGELRDMLLGSLADVAPSVPQQVFVTCASENLQALRFVRTLSLYVHVVELMSYATLKEAVDSALPPDPVCSALRPVFDQFTHAAARTFARYCLRHARENIRVEGACRAIKTSYTRVEAAFKPLGVSPGWVVRACRVLAAAQSAERGRGSREDRAKALGYPSQAALYESFKRFTGWSIVQLPERGGVAGLVQSVVSELMPGPP